MVNIVPTILAKDVDSFEADLKKVETLVKRVQVDIIDGKFAQAETVTPEFLSDLETSVEFEGHLMVEDPHSWIERCAASGITTLYGQVEMMKDVVAFIADVEFAGLRVGLAYDIDTSLDGLEDVVDNLDGVLLMSVKAGKQGQLFDDRVLQKIKDVRRMSKTVKIVVDGGLNLENYKKCIAAEWAEEIAEDELSRDLIDIEFAIGSDLLEADDVKGELEKLENLGVIV